MNYFYSVTSVSLRLIVLLIICNYCNWVSSQPPFVVQKEFNPCPLTSIIKGEKNSNGPPGKRNNWMGTIYLDKWPNLSTIKLDLLFDNQAKVKLKDNIGRILPIDEGYQIYYEKSSAEIKKIDFNVNGKPNRGFPNIIGLFLNGIDICKSTDYSNISETPSRKDDDINNSSEYPDIRYGGEYECGIRQIQHQGLVTYGYPSKEGDWPWHSAIFLRKDSNIFTFICGGSLISPTTVLTAAHCLVDGDSFVIPQRIFVKIGLYNRLLNSPNTKEYQIYDIVIRDKFDMNNLSNDLALLKTSNKIIYTKFIQPVCLWPEEYSDLSSVVNRDGTVIGWGVNEKEKLTDILTQGNMPVVGLTECLQSNRDFFGHFLTDSNFCAGFRNGTSVCNGDSGGGMYFEKDNIYYLRGIVSLAVAQPDRNVCNPKEYVIFTDVAKHLKWITNNS